MRAPPPGALCFRASGGDTIPRTTLLLLPDPTGSGAGVLPHPAAITHHPTQRESTPMCRNIKTLFHFDPPVTDAEIRAAALQYVRKISGFQKPSKTNEAAFAAAIDEVSAASAKLLASLETTGPLRNREEEAAKTRARGLARFGT